MEITGCLWLGLLISSDNDKLKRSIVSLEILVNSPPWIRLTSLFGTSGNAAPNDETHRVLILSADPGVWVA